MVSQRLHTPSILSCGFHNLLGLIEQNQGKTPLELDALLLLALPEVLTLQKFVALETLGEHSHQLHADTVCDLFIS